MSIASVALAGIWPLAGFFSKDKILEVAFGDGYMIIWAVLLLTAGMTAFYSFRLVMKVFFGEENYKKDGVHPHEAYTYMLLAISPLVLLAIVAGWFEHAYYEFVSKMLPMHMPHVEHSTLYVLIAVTLGLVILSITFAVVKYKNGGFDKSWEDTMIYKLLINQYYIPQAYENFLTKPYKKLSEIAWSIDNKVVDATVDFIANIFYVSGEKLSSTHNGNLSTMLRTMTLGFLAILIVAIILKVGV
jgi:NADH-quinone oxidoreductase subunit L